MAKVTHLCHERTGRAAFICDFSPPRSGDPAALRQADIDADFIAVAYNPGRAARVNSAMLAAAIKDRAGKDVTFTLATRDMNKLALQSQLLGAQLLGLENVIVVAGDPFNRRDEGLVKEAADVRPTQLIQEISNMNQGADFRGSKLLSPTNFCIGGTLDLGRGIEEEARLAYKKVEAGAHFFISQPIFDVADAARFQEAFAAVDGAPLALPVFFGLQILEEDGVVFSPVPERTRQGLAQGRSGASIALELYQAFRENGLNNIYLVPPIRQGGERNYDAARQVLAAVDRS